MEEAGGVGENGGGLADAGIDPGDELAGSDLDAYFLHPMLLAVLFALVSLPLVALSLNVGDYRLGLGPDLNPIQVSDTDIGRWEGAFGAVVAAGLIAGTIGALLVRANALWGGLLTMVIAWVVAIAALPVLPALLNSNHGGALGFGSYCAIGPGTCQAAITASDASSGLKQVWLFWFAPLVEPVPFAVLALGVAYWTRMVRSWTPEPPVTFG
jgi:hypothetical protein